MYFPNEDNSELIYKEIVKENTLEKKYEIIDKINIKDLFRISSFIIINVIIYIIFSVISIKLINYLGDNYLLQVNNARLIISILSLIGTFLFMIITSNAINKIINLLIVYDLQKSGIDLISLNKISKKNIITIIKYIFKKRNGRWIAPVLLLSLPFFNNLFFNRVINIYAINKQIPKIINIPKYTNDNQIKNTLEKINYLNNGDTTYIIGNTPNTITWINNTNTVGSVNNKLLTNYNNFEVLDNITLPTFTSNCILPEYIWEPDNLVNISVIDTTDISIMKLTNFEFGNGSNYTNNLWPNGVPMSIIDRIYNSTLSLDRFLIENIIALRINGNYIKNLNSSHIYGLTIKCYTILEFVSAKIYINGTIINKNENKIQDKGLSILSKYGMINTINALLRDSILDVQYKPGPIAKTLFIINDNNLIENINPNISQTISKMYSLLWPEDAFTKDISNGLGFQTYIVSFSELNILLLIIWILIWFILIIVSCISIYNLINIEHDEITIFRYIKDINNLNNKDTIVYLVENENNRLYYKTEQEK